MMPVMLGKPTFNACAAAVLDGIDNQLVDTGHVEAHRGSGIFHQ